MDNGEHQGNGQIAGPPVIRGLALLLIVGCVANSAIAADKPNLIYILADDLGYGDLGCYGQKQMKTPNIDKMAAEGMKFSRHYAGSTVCAPSRCVLMTGLHLGHCYIRGNGKVDLRPKDVTVAEVMKAGGYTTALIGKWGLGHEGGEGQPTRQGFDYFFGYLDQHHAHNFYPHFLMRNEERVPLKNVVPNPGPYGQGVATEKVEYSHDLFAEEALAFVDKNKENPFFLYLALTIPHANNEAGDKGMEVPDLGEFADKDWPEPAKGQAAMVARMDADIGRLLARLKTHGIDDNTLVIFTSDNGPHNEGGHRAETFGSSGELRGTKRDLYEGGIRVPFIARWPSKIKAGSNTAHIAYFGDLMATAGELAGVKPPNGIDSISYLPVLLGKDKEQQRHPFLYWEFFERGSAQAIVMGDWKAVRKPAFTGPIELYKLSDDIGETKDLANGHPEIVARMSDLITGSHVPNPLWKVRTKKPKAKPKKK
ncbi:MAG: arylsulfatase A-like enzyme [Rhodothermales bacterium]